MAEELFYQGKAMLLELLIDLHRQQHMKKGRFSVD